MAAASPELDRAARFHHAAQRALVLQRHGTVYDRADRTRQRWDTRWGEALASVWPGAHWDPAAADEAARAARAGWARVRKAAPENPGEGAEATGRPPRTPSRPPVPTPEPPDLLPNVEAAIARRVGDARQFATRALPVYVSLAADTSEDAGQSTLDALGLNSTFRWTTARDMPRQLFAVRGSKVLMGAHDRHLGRLAQIVVDATRPEAPAGQSRLQARLREEWPAASASSIARVARTESANVWETTNYNVARANGITEFDWLIAHGPSIGPPASGPVCPECLERAAKGPYRAGDGDWELPPQHPNCRCTLVPALSKDWLPPATTWSGGPNPPLPLVPAEAPR